MSKTLRGLLFALVILLLVIMGGTIGYFMVQNAQWVVLRFPAVQADWSDPLPMMEFETPLPVVMAVSFGLGLVLAVLIFSPSWLRRAWERRQERRFINSLEGELTDLRNMPVTDPAPLEDIDEIPLHLRQPDEGDAEDEEEALLAAALQEPAAPPRKEAQR